jgi:hypothetical protein
MYLRDETTGAVMMIGSNDPPVEGTRMYQDASGRWLPGEGSFVVISESEGDAAMTDAADPLDAIMERAIEERRGARRKLPRRMTADWLAHSLATSGRAVAALHRRGYLMTVMTVNVARDPLSTEDAKIEADIALKTGCVKHLCRAIEGDALFLALSLTARHESSVGAAP